MDEELVEAVALFHAAVRMPDLWPSALRALGAVMAQSHAADRLPQSEHERSLREGHRLASCFSEGWRAGMRRSVLGFPDDGEDLNRTAGEIRHWGTPIAEKPCDLAERVAMPGEVSATGAPVEHAVVEASEAHLAQDVPDAAESRDAPGRSGRLGALAAFDHLLVPVILLDRRGLVMQANRHADFIVGSDLRINRGNLVASDAASHVDLQRLIQEALRERSVADDGAPQPAVIRRAARRPLVVDAVPANAAFGDLLGGAVALLLIRDLEQRAIPIEAHIRRVFDLTKSELRLVMLIAEGEDLVDCGTRLGWSRETTRTVLKTVFSKTETHRQAELVALLARMRHENAGPTQ